MILLIRYCWTIKKDSWLAKFFNKIQSFFLFTVYIRLAIESQQMILISSFSEIKHADFSKTERIVSLSFALFHIIFACVLCFGIFYTWISLIFKSETQVSAKTLREMRALKAKSNKSFRERYLGEIFTGLSSKFKSRSFYLVTSLRTLIMWLLVVATENLYVMIVIQVVFILVVIYIMPMEKVHLNIIEVQGECLFLALMLFLIYFDNMKTWANGFGLDEEELFG